jgi:hypothetical protein
MIMMQEKTLANKDKGFQGGRYAQTEEELYKKALALLEECKNDPGPSGQEVPELEPAT